MPPATRPEVSTCRAYRWTHRTSRHLPRRIEDEKNSIVELGMKTTLLDGRATLNVAGYRTVVEDYQANIVSSL